MKLLFTLLSLTAWTSMTASADWGPLPLKSLVEHSDCIVVAEFISEDSRKIDGHRIDQEVTLKVTSVITGEPPAQIIVSGSEDPRMCKAQFIFPTTKSEKYLLFLQKRNDQYSVFNGIYGALTITGHKVNWFTDETLKQSEERKPTELDTVITAIKNTKETSPSPALPKAQDIEVLMQIETFGFGGKKGQNERVSDTAFKALLSNPNPKEKFTTLFEKGSTCSKLYALSALHSIDPPAFDKLSKSIKADEMILTQFGCIVGEVKVSEILKNISNGDYDADCKVPK